MTLRTAIAVLLVLLLACSSDEEKHDGHLERARAAQERGDHGAAIIEYRSTLQLDPNRGETHYALALSFLAAGRFSDGVWELREAVRLEPGNLEARLRLGWLALAAGEVDEALEQAGVILDGDGSHLEGRHLFAAALLAKGDAAGAASDSIALLAQYPDDALAHYHLARARADQGRQEEATEALLRFHELDGGSPKATREVLLYFRSTNQTERADRFARDAVEQAAPADRAEVALLWADFLEEQGRGDELEEPLRLALGADPGRVAFRERLLRWLVERERSAEALALAEAALAASPGDPQLLGLVGDAQLASGRPAEALEAYRAGLAAAPESRALRLREVDALLRTGDLEASAEKVQALLEERPADPAVALAAVRALAVEGRSQEAIDSLQELVAGDPALAPAQFLLGVLLLAEERPAEALRAIEAAKQHSEGPARIEARRLLAEAQLRTGALEAARRDADAVLAEHPDDLRMRLVLAEARLGTGDVAGALAGLDEIEDANAAVHAARARVLVRAGRLSDARIEAERARALEPDSAQRIVDLVWLLQQLGESDEALEAARESMLAHPERPEDANLVGRVLVEQGNDAAARQAFQRTVEIDPGFSTGYVNLARVDERAGRIVEARASLRRALAARPNDPEALRTLGALEYRSGNPAAAAKAFEAALRADPGSLATQTDLARARAEAGRDLDLALEIARAARRSNPESADVAEALGRVLDGKGLYAAAADQYRAAIELAPHPIASYHYRLGVSLLRSGDPAKGSEALRRALAIDPGFAQAEEARRLLKQYGPPPAARREGSRGGGVLAERATRSGSPLA